MFRSVFLLDNKVIVYNKYMLCQQKQSLIDRETDIEAMEGGGPYMVLSYADATKIKWRKFARNFTWKIFILYFYTPFTE